MIFKIFLTAFLIVLLFPSRSNAVGRFFSSRPKDELELISKYGLDSELIDRQSLQRKAGDDILKKHGIHSKTTWCHPVLSNLTFKLAYEEFDKNGNIMQFANFDRNGRIVKLGEYEYDHSGRQTAYIEYGPAGSISIKTTRNYDLKGRLTEFVHCEAGGEPVFIHTFAYGKDIIEETRRSVRENKNEKRVYKYAGDRIIKRSCYAAGGENAPVSVETYFYDDKGICGVSVSDAAGAEKLKWSYLCDTDGYPLLESFNDNYNKTALTKIFEYDENHGLLRHVETLETGSGKTITTITYNYSREGEIVKTTCSGHDKEKTVETMIFDRNLLPVKLIEYDEEGRPAVHYRFELRKFYPERMNIDPKLLVTEESIKMECTRNMRLIEGNIDLFAIEKNRHPISLDELVRSGYISKLPKCLRDGEYSFSFGEGQLNVRCSFHGNLY